MVKGEMEGVEAELAWIRLSSRISATFSASSSASASYSAADVPGGAVARSAAPISARTSPSNLRKRCSARRRRLLTANTKTAILAEARAARTEKLPLLAAPVEGAVRFGISKVFLASRVRVRLARVQAA